MADTESPLQSGHDLRCDEGIVALRNAVQSGARTATSIVQDVLDRIDRFDSKFHSYVRVRRDEALAAAADVDRRLRSGLPVGELSGVPVAVKDVYAVQGVVTTQCSAAYQGVPARENAAVVDRLRQSDAVLIGVNTCHELAYGPTGDVSFPVAAVNPYDITRVPGGSSSGSAVAVATGMAAGAVGSDTGGSVRIPASLCGVVGLKPTTGLVSRRGMSHLAPTLDHVGLFTRSVEDSEAMLRVLAGYDRADRASRFSPQHPAVDALDPTRLRVGILRGYFENIEEQCVSDTFDNAVRALRQRDVTAVPIILESASAATAAQRAIVAAEAVGSHDDLDDASISLLGNEVRTRLTDAHNMTARKYVAARSAADRFRAELLAAFEHVDILMCPTTPVLAPRTGERLVAGAAGATVYEALTRFTSAFNTVDTPVLSIPVGFSPSGLPIGIQLIAPPFGENIAYQVAAQLETLLECAATSPFHHE